MPRVGLGRQAGERRSAVLGSRKPLAYSEIKVLAASPLALAFNAAIWSCSSVSTSNTTSSIPSSTSAHVDGVCGHVFAEPSRRS